MSEKGLIESSKFAYRCTQLCSRMKKLLCGPMEQIVCNASSIIEQMEETEDKRASVYNDAAPGAYVYQGNLQLHLSTNVLVFLSVANQGDISSRQRIQFARVQRHCTSVFHETASGILTIDYHTIGWGDAIMVLTGLRTIATSHLSLPVQRDAARRACNIIKEQLGFKMAKL